VEDGTVGQCSRRHCRKTEKEPSKRRTNSKRLVCWGRLLSLTETLKGASTTRQKKNPEATGKGARGTGSLRPVAAPVQGGEGKGEAGALFAAWGKGGTRPEGSGGATAKQQ